VSNKKQELDNFVDCTVSRAQTPL